MLGLHVNFVEDFEFENGYISPYLVTDPGSMLAVLDDPYILFCAEKISDVRSLMPMLERIMRDPRPLVIIAEKVEGSALQMLVHNHVNGHLKVTAIQAPGFGEKRIHLLEDMAALCGGKVLSKASAFSLEQMGVEHLGRARQVHPLDVHVGHGVLVDTQHRQQCGRVHVHRGDRETRGVDDQLGRDLDPGFVGQFDAHERRPCAAARRAARLPPMAVLGRPRCASSARP